MTSNMQAIIGVMIGAYIIAKMMEITVTAPATNQGKALKGVAVLVGLVGAVGMFLYQAAVSWRLRRFVRKNCAACVTRQNDNQ